MAASRTYVRKVAIASLTDRIWPDSLAVSTPVPDPWRHQNAVTTSVDGKRGVVVNASLVLGLLHDCMHTSLHTNLSRRSELEPARITNMAHIRFYFSAESLIV